MKRLLVIGVAVLAMTAALPVASAGAAFPGRNGNLVFHRFFPRSVEIMTIKPSGAGLAQLTATATVEDRSPAWSADGERIALFRAGGPIKGLWVMQADGTGLTQVPGTDLDRDPEWSPAGDRLVSVCRTSVGAVADLLRPQLDGSGLQQLTATQAEEAEPVWSPDGNRILFRRYTAHGSHLVTLNLTTLVETNLTSPLAGRYDYLPDWSPSGTEVAFTRWVSGSGIGGAIYRMPFGKGVPTLVTAPSGNDVSHTMPAWSPDGKKIAYSVLDDDEAFGHIFVVNANGSGNTQLTFGAVTDETPDWQPR